MHVGCTDAMMGDLLSLYDYGFILKLSKIFCVSFCLENNIHSRVDTQNIFSWDVKVMANGWAWDKYLIGNNNNKKNIDRIGRQDTYICVLSLHICTFFVGKDKSLFLLLIQSYMYGNVIIIATTYKRCEKFRAISQVCGVPKCIIFAPGIHTK